MIMLTLPESGVRNMMEQLLRRDTFDAFDLRAVSVQSFARFDIEGIMPAGSGEPSETKLSFCKWKQIRPYVLNIIKGNERPRFIKAVLSYPQERLASEFPDAGALFINIIFDKNLMNVTTGTSMRVFSMDKTVESMWDSFVQNFLKKNNLYFESNGGAEENAK